MIPELGHFALILALLVALVQGTLPLLGAAIASPRLMALARPAARAQALLVAIAFGCLAWSFISNDFSVQNVATNSNSQLPLAYRIAATWGSHEGSLLLWTLMLGGWSFAVTMFSRNLPPPLLARVLAVMGLVSVGFLLFLLLTSNPFERLMPPAADGRGATGGFPSAGCSSSWSRRRRGDADRRQDGRATRFASRGHPPGPAGGRAVMTARPSRTYPGRAGAGGRIKRQG